MIRKLKLAILTISALAVLLEMSNISFANATYTMEHELTQISIQSPVSNNSYNESSVKLEADVRLIYGTSSPVDEFSSENLACGYSVDRGEWINFDSTNITSNTASPDINFWNGFLHRLNVTYSAEFWNLTDGQHSVEIKLKTNDSWGGYQDVAQANFTTNTQTSPTPSPAIPEFPAWIILPLIAAATTASLVYVKTRGQK